MCLTSYLKAILLLSRSHLIHCIHAAITAKTTTTTTTTTTTATTTTITTTTTTMTTPQQFVLYRYDHTGACRFSLFPATLCHSGQRTSSIQLKGDTGYSHMNYPLNTSGYSCQMDAALGKDPFFFSDTELTWNLQWITKYYKVLQRGVNDC